MAGRAAADDYGTFGSVPNETPSGGSGGTPMQVRADPNAFGAQVAAGVEGLASQTDQLAQHYQDIYSDAAARDGTTKASQMLSDAEMQLKSQHGLNAVKALPVFQDQMTQIRNNVMATLPAPARKAFLDQFSGEINNSLNRAGSWVGEQTEKAQVSSLNSAIASKISLGAMNMTDPQSRASTVSSIRDLALQRAHYEGLDPVSADAMVQSNLGMYYQTGIHSLAQSNPDQAKKLFDEATQSSFMVTRPDANGNMQQVQVPYINAEHRAEISNEMNVEFHKQAAEEYNTAANYAKLGEDFDTDRLKSAWHNAGYNNAYADSQIQRLAQIRDRYGASKEGTAIRDDLKNDMALAEDGKAPVGVYDAARVAKAFPNNSEMQADILDKVNNIHTVAGIVSGFKTQSLDEIQDSAKKFAPVSNDKASSFDSAYGFVAKEEGGFVSNDSGKGPTNFGVNKEANPDVDVANLTQDKASALLHDRYWKAIGADNMSPDFARVAFDGAVNQGVGATKEMIAEADGDPQKLIDLRRDKYAAIAAANPDKYDQYLPAWNARLDRLQATLGQDSPTSAEGNYKSQSWVHDTVADLANDYTKKMLADPAGMLMKDNPQMQTLLTTGWKDPVSFGAFAQASLAQQDAKGVPEKNQSVLPQENAVKIVSSITSNPQTAPETLTKLAAVTGSYWPQVYKSLVRQGKLPVGYQSVAQLGSSDNPETQKDAALLARFMGDTASGKNGEKENIKPVEELMGAGTVTEFKNSVEADPAVNNLLTSLGRSGSSPAQAESVKQSVINLAFAKQYYQNDPNAVANAIKSFTSDYEFMPNGGARVPAKYIDVVSKNAEATLQNIDKLAASPDVYNTGYHGAVKPEDYFAQVKGNPTWVNDTDGSGIILKNVWDRTVLGKNGKPIKIAFAPAALPEAKSPPSDSDDYTRVILGM